MDIEYLKSKIREVMDFPTVGIKFKDITPLLEDPKAFHQSVAGLTEFFQDKKVDKVVGIDARGFLLSAPVAYLLGAGTVIVRKKGKLPYDKIVQTHDLEYGHASLEIHTDSIKKGERVAIIDDLLATGGTAEAAVKLVKNIGGEIVGMGFLIELESMNGRKKFDDVEVHSLLKF